VRPGEDIQVAVDTRQMHFFDPETGLGIYHDVPEPAAAAAPA
jgi:multiple sugar transport system ATP-binding protein